MKNTTKSKTQSAKSKKVAPKAKQAAKKAKATQHVGFQSTKIDFMTSVFIVSLLLNLVAATVWITLQVTNQYDYAMYQLFIGR